MAMDKSITRRSFASAIAAVPLAGLASQGVEKPSGEGNPRSIEISVFSKHLQWLDYPQMAEKAAEVGFDGVDLTVRNGGHVEPDQVRRDLPRAVQAVQAAGLSVKTITTGIVDAKDKKTVDILSTASELGIRYYRMGYYRYDDSVTVEQNLLEISGKLQELANLNRQFQMIGDYQNHAGKGYFGASIWDIWYTMKDLETDYTGIQFDLRHASVEGALNWPVDFRLVSNRCHTLVAKDYTWGSGEDKIRLQECPFGEGMSDFPQLFSLLQGMRWKSPIIMHFEYPLGGANHGSKELDCSPEVILLAMKKDLGVLKYHLKEASLI